MCCGFEAWTNGETPYCFLTRGGVQDEQTEDLENAVFSSLVFQYESLEDYEEPEWEEDWEEEHWDDYGEEDWEDWEDYGEEWYGRCDWENACFVTIGGTHFFCRE